mmetsp:Transcript_6964/g.26829  ORF Transcript_6964/g.26829 Transcript_6964/m.26829 type:complete len:561 (+) Transcript_6964:336-2018(+)|eukprot:scaffold870_cov268-Pinguiococcus_pyrenoidosus.AAC.54
MHSPLSFPVPLPLGRVLAVSRGTRGLPQGGVQRPPGLHGDNRGARAVLVLKLLGQLLAGGTVEAALLHRPVGGAEAPAAGAFFVDDRLLPVDLLLASAGSRASLGLLRQVVELDILLGKLGVGRTLVVLEVQAEQLRVLVHAKETAAPRALDRVEDRQQKGRGRGHGGDDDGRAQQLADEQAGVSAVQEALVVVIVGVEGEVRPQQVALREEGDGDDAPQAVGAVHREGVQRVIDGQRDQRDGGELVHREGDGADDDRRPRRHVCARRRDGHQASENRVVRGRQVATSDDDDLVEQQRRHGRRRGHDRVDGGSAGELQVDRGDGQGRRRVERDPSHEEDVHAEVGHGRAVAAEVGHLDDRAAALVALHLEAQRARAHDDARGEGGDAAGQVHHSGAGEVHVAPVLGEEAIGVPAPAHDDGVQEGHEDEGLHEVRRQRHALRHRSGHDGGGRHGEGERVEPGQEVGRVPHGVVVADGARGALSRDAEAHEVPRQRTDAHVRDVLEQNGLGVLTADTTQLEQREARLHEGDVDTVEEQPDAQHGNLQVLHPGFQLAEGRHGA